jgi:hypothetical protein
MKNDLLLDNNSTCKGACARVENKNIFSQGKFDISMLDNLISYIDNQKSTVI